jgi:hypothetical protein
MSLHQEALKLKEGNTTRERFGTYSTDGQSGVGELAGEVAEVSGDGDAFSRDAHNGGDKSKRVHDGLFYAIQTTCLLSGCSGCASQS